MNYESFKNLCIEISKKFEDDEESQLLLEHYHNRDGVCNEKIIDDPILYVEWEIGGLEEGGCWEDEEPKLYTSSNPPKDLEILDAILEKICPTINFLKYKKLYNQLAKNGEYSQDGYYGNRTDYATKIIYIKELFTYLIDNGIITNE